MNPVKVKLGSMEFTLEPRAFESGKLGYGLYGQFPIDGMPLQVSVNLVVPHSEASVTDESKALRTKLAEQVKARAAKKAAKAK